MRVKTKRWNDPVEPDDGVRVLVTRYRPRALRKHRENWDEWLPNLGPSVALHAAAYGKTGDPLDFPDYRERYLAEMRAQLPAISRLAGLVANGSTLTLLCSSACTDAAKCHRTLLRILIFEMLKVPPPDEATAQPSATSAMSDKLRKWLE